MTSQEVALARVLKAIEAVKDGRMVIMVDDEDRENEGDLVFSAKHVSPEKINFMTKEARGLICLSLQQECIDRLKLPMMEDSGRRNGTKSTAFTVSIEARLGVTTGISAADRAHTIKVACDENSTADDIVVPGHIFPLKARSAGVLERAGHTEGSVDLCRLAGLPSAAVICEIMNDDGTMARLPDLELFSRKHDIPIVTIADLITFRLLKESLIEVVQTGPVNTEHGVFQGVLFRSLIDDLMHLALVKGENFEHKVVEVRVHRQRNLLDVLGHPRDGGRLRLDYGLKLLAQADAAVFVYLTHAVEKHELQQEFEALLASPKAAEAANRPPASWVDKEARMLGVGAQILRHLGVRQMCVHMSQPGPLKGLMGFELEVVGTKSIQA